MSTLLWLVTFSHRQQLTKFAVMVQGFASEAVSQRGLSALSEHIKSQRTGGSVADYTLESVVPMEQDSDG